MLKISGNKKIEKKMRFIRPPETNREMYINVFITYLYIIYVCIFIYI